MLLLKCLFSAERVLLSRYIFTKDEIGVFVHDIKGSELASCKLLKFKEEILFVQMDKEFVKKLAHADLVRIAEVKLN